MSDQFRPQGKDPLPPDDGANPEPASPSWSAPPPQGDNSVPATEAFDLPASHSLEDSFDTSILAATENPTSLGRLGKYEILKVVGQGGMGVVFHGFDEALHRPVAIKALARQLATSPTARRRFIREARAAAAINHPNVVTIHAVEDQDGQPYLVMEYIEGRSLHDHIRQHAPLPVVDVLRLSAQIAAGLAAAHAHGVIHRDIKPANIMLEDNVERIKITDFGLARVALDNTDLTSQGHRLGTPAYMSPEQVRGVEVDERTDLFSMGCVVYAMLTGHSPFRGAHAFETARKILDETPESLDRVTSEVPPFLAEIVDRLLAKRPSSRFLSAAEVADLLNYYTTKINQTSTDEISKVLRSERLRPGKRSLRTWLLAIPVVVVVLLVGFFWKPWQTRATVAVTDLALEPPVVAEPTDLPWLRGTLTVARSRDALPGERHFRSIQEALQRAGPGATIEVVDEATYAGTIEIADAERYRDITLLASHGATLSAPFASPVIKIHATPRVTLRGFHVEAYHGQHGLIVSGPCPGTVIEGMTAKRLPNPSSPALVSFAYFRAGAAGTQEAPIVLRHLTLTGGGHGIAIGELAATEADRQNPVRWLRVEECTLVNAEGRRDYRLFLLNYVSDIVITRNTFADAEIGISMLLKTPHQAQRVQIHQNSFHNLTGLMTLDADLKQDDITITSNLISRTDGVTPGRLPPSALPTSWFAANAWLDSSAATSAASAIATLLNGVTFESEDSHDANYLRPTAASRESLRAVGSDEKFPGRFVSE